MFCQVTARIGYPITGYGNESRNRAARQRIPNRVWTDEDGVEHVEVLYYSCLCCSAAVTSMLSCTSRLVSNSIKKYKFTVGGCNI